MPLTKHGRKIKGALTKQYGHEKGKQVFYAMANARSGGGKGCIGGKRVHKADTLQEWIKENGNG